MLLPRAAATPVLDDTAAPETADVVDAAHAVVTPAAIRIAALRNEMAIAHAPVGQSAPPVPMTRLYRTGSSAPVPNERPRAVGTAPEP